MDIVERFRGLEFGDQIGVTTLIIGILTLLVAAIGVGFQIRSYRVDRTEQKRAERHEAHDRRAILVLETAVGDNRAAAFSLGTVIHDGPQAGQHFVAAIKNDGPLMADNIHVAASLGDLTATVVSAPQRLPPHSSAALIDLLVPFGTLMHADIMERIRNEPALHVRVHFTDGTSSPALLDQCFVFRLEQTDGGGMNWVSHREECPYPAT